MVVRPPAAPLVAGPPAAAIAAARVAAATAHQAPLAIYIRHNAPVSHPVRARLGHSLGTSTDRGVNQGGWPELSSNIGVDVPR